MSSERLSRMNKAIHAYVDAGRTPGVVTLILRHGKVVHSDVYGKADLESGRASRADDLFRMYSMTKPITSVALLMLFEEGRFQLTDPLAKFFPAVADMKVFAGTTPQGGVLLDAQKRPITIQDVFRHSAGFSYGFGATPVDKSLRRGQSSRHGTRRSHAETAETVAAVPARRPLGVQRCARRAGRAGREAVRTEIR